MAEEDPPRLPEPLGEPVLTFTFVYSEHDSNVVKRSQTGILLFVCNGEIKDFSKRKNTVKSSTFRSGLVELHIFRDLIVELRIKLYSIGVSVKGLTDTYCNNQGVAKNTSVPRYLLSKKHNSINHHVISKTAAAKILRVGKEVTATNFANPLTKFMPYSQKNELLGHVCIIIIILGRAYI